jgi:hypothetical protein
VPTRAARFAFQYLQLPTHTIIIQPTQRDGLKSPKLILVIKAVHNIQQKEFQDNDKVIGLCPASFEGRLSSGRFPRVIKLRVLIPGWFERCCGGVESERKEAQPITHRRPTTTGGQGRHNGIACSQTLIHDVGVLASRNVNGQYQNIGRAILPRTRCDLR